MSVQEDPDTVMPNTSCLEAGDSDAEGGGWTPSVRLVSVEFICPIVILVLFNTVVIVGNTLVVLAVFTHTKLRTVTNTFIVSLAVADLLLGVAVLPFSSANEVLRYWPFGPAWCDVWLAIDVWVCTASILNLCAISLDRYVAISRPFKYPRLMSHVRARVLVASVWVVSFLVCFPPLIGWKETDPVSESSSSSWSGTAVVPMDTTVHTLSPNVSVSTPGNLHPRVPHWEGVLYTETEGNATYYTMKANRTTRCADQAQAPICRLTSEPGYIIYSALGSFWLPMLVMVFFYWKIYRAAIRTTSAIRKGVLVTKGGHLHSSDPDSQVTLRVHRGGGECQRQHQPQTPPPPPSPGTSKCPRFDVYKRSKSSPATSSGDYQSSNGHGKTRMYKPNPRAVRGSNGARRGLFTVDTTGAATGKSSRAVRITFGKAKQKSIEDDSTSAGERKPLRTQQNHQQQQHEPQQKVVEERPSQVFRNLHVQHNGNSGVDSAQDNQVALTENTHGHSATDTRTGGGGGGAGFLNKVGRIQLKSHIKRINKEKKAAKTVGIIVGCFIVCWAPFFTVYLLGAFCPHCAPDIVFSIFFWLGYCNSAINPFLYAMCSKDFRYAFKKLLRCRVERRRVERTSTRFLNFINSIRIQISSKGSDSNSE